MEQVAEKLISLPLERSSRTLGTDELNICEFPLTSTGRAGSPANTLVFEDDIFDEGTQQSVHRKLVVSSSEAFGLPTPADNDVLLVLMHLTNMRNGFTDRTVTFSRYELVKALGWDHGGKSYRRIEDALNRWVNVTLNYNRAWWDRDGKRWQTKAFHILESIDLNGRGDGRDDGTSTFTWNNVIFSSIQQNNVKRLDLDTYFRLKSPTAKQAYRFLDKRFYRTKMLEFDLRIFACEHLGLSRSYDFSQLKRKLQPAIEELEGISFLKTLPITERYNKRQRGDWTIKLIRASESDKCEVPVMPHSEQPLEKELRERGIHEAQARELIATFAENRIREKISMLDWLIMKGGERSPKNPAGYLMAAIREDYQPPQDFGNQRVVPKSEKPVTPSKQAAAQLAAEKRAQARLDKARNYFLSLTESEQQEIETQAMANGNRFRVETYQRLKGANNALANEVRDDLIASYLSSSQAS